MAGGNSAKLFATGDLALLELERSKLQHAPGNRRFFSVCSSLHFGRRPRKAPGIMN